MIRVSSIASRIYPLSEKALGHFREFSFASAERLKKLSIPSYSAPAQADELQVNVRFRCGTRGIRNDDRADAESGTQHESIKRRAPCHVHRRFWPWAF